jgi:hypothetical protein
MALLGEISIPAAELYVLRFCVTKSKLGGPIAAKRYRPLLEFAQLEWAPRTKGFDHVLLDREPVATLTDEHFNLIQLNAAGFGQLFVWFPPRAQPSGDEGRLLVRAGVPLKFVVQKIGVYIRDVSKYNG